MGTSLSEIEISPVLRVPSARTLKKEDEGTTLHIKGLREAWTDAQIARAYRFIDELIQPFPLSKRTKLPGEPDPGFKATFYKRIGGKDIEVASEDRMVFDHALAEVTATVNARGKGHWHLVSKRYDLDEKTQFSPDKERPNLTFKHLRNVHLKAYYFIWHPALVPRQQSTQLRKLWLTSKVALGYTEMALEFFLTVSRGMTGSASMNVTVNGRCCFQ